MTVYNKNNKTQTKRSDERDKSKDDEIESAADRTRADTRADTAQALAKRISEVRPAAPHDNTKATETKQSCQTKTTDAR